MKNQTFLKRAIAVPVAAALLSFGALSTMPAQAQDDAPDQAPDQVQVQDFHHDPVFPSQLPNDGGSYRVHFAAKVLRIHGENEIRVLGDDGVKYTVRAGFPLDNWRKGDRVHVVGFSVHAVVSADRIEPIS